jgi:hypothetical protein
MDFQYHLHLAERLSTLLDDQFRVGPWKFGLDPIMGLIPVVGDIMPLLLTVYILWIGHQVGISDRVRHKIIFNATADAVLGIIPIVGDISDFAWKANIRNIALLKKYLAERPLEGEVVTEGQLSIGGSL